MTMRTETLALLAAALLAQAAAVPLACAQKPPEMPRYEPSQRLRTAIETCMRDEVQNGAYCVKKCQADFRIDLAARSPRCIATKANAKHVPVKPNWTPPQSSPAKSVPGA